MAQLPKVVLAAVDFSDASARAVEHAALIAACAKGRVVLVHVVNVAPPAVGVDMTGMAPTLDVEGEMRAAREAMPRFEQLAGPGAEVLVRVGSPQDEILRAARETGAEMLVMGTHGRRGLARMLVGSVAEAVARRAAVPVVLVH